MKTLCYGSKHYMEFFWQVVGRDGLFSGCLFVIENWWVF